MCHRSLPFSTDFTPLASFFFPIAGLSQACSLTLTREQMGVVQVGFDYAEEEEQGEDAVMRVQLLRKPLADCRDSIDAAPVQVPVVPRSAGACAMHCQEDGARVCAA